MPPRYKSEGGGGGHPEIVFTIAIVFTEHEMISFCTKTQTTRLGLPVTEHTRSTSSPTVASRLPSSVLLWGDEGVTAREIFCVRCNISVAICSDIFYGVVDRRRKVKDAVTEKPEGSSEATGRGLLSG